MRSASLYCMPLVVVALLAWQGCKGKARNQDQDHAQGPAGAEQSGADQAGLAVDPRSQYDLAAAIAEAERMYPDEAEDALDRIRREWQGERFRWKVYLVPALCPSAERCHVVPFDRAGADRAILQGWMPRLELAPAAFAALSEQCGDRPRCAIEFEGTLSRLVLSTDDLTALHFGDVRIVDRAPDKAPEQAPEQ
jgi:hypothetical protein